MGILVGVVKCHLCSKLTRHSEDACGGEVREKERVEENVTWPRRR